jgi:hypothetical protein
MKMTVISFVIPYPANMGARVDIWRRIKAFSEVGVELQLVSWYNSQPKAQEIAEMEKYCKKLYLIPFKDNITSIAQRIIALFSYPLEVTSRILRGKELSNLLSEVRAFNPDVIWLDGIHGGYIAAKLSEKLQVPLLTRSHNIEYLYYRRLLKATIDLKSRIKRYLSLAHLESYEKKLLKSSVFFYDISADDLKFWQNQGFTNGRYLPPFVEFEQDNKIQNKNDTNNLNPMYDIVYLGNLYANNNVASIIWFITQVFPIIRSTTPNIKVLVAGLNPVTKIRELCEAEEGVELRINPPSSAEIYQSGRVLINPVLSGSGVSIKSIEMLVHNRPIVSTPQGIAGLPDKLRQYFRIAEEPQSFAEEIIKLLSDPHTLNVDRSLIESLFSSQAIKDVVSDIQSII